MKQPEIKNIPIGLIRPYWNNPRSASEEAVAKVRKSIEDYGFNQPIVVGQDMVIIVGHTRYKALMDIGATEVLCVVVDMDNALATEYRIVDNRTNELTSWDNDLLLSELRDIGPGDIQLFFPDIDLNGALQGLEATREATLSTTSGVDTELPASQPMGDSGEPRHVSRFGDGMPLICPECAQEFVASRHELLYPE